jgi:UDP-N-acetyl-2-amino-2-deoxyglucuronate dehydrogenase
LLGDVRRVYGKAVAAQHAIEVEDTVVAVLELASGAVGTLEATTAAWPGYSRRVALSGTNGTVIVEQDRVVRRDLKDAPDSATAVDATPAQSAASPIVSDASAHRRVLEDFLDALDRGRPPSVNLGEGRRSVAVVRAIYQSSREGRPVDL